MCSSDSVFTAVFLLVFGVNLLFADIRSAHRAQFGNVWRKKAACSKWNGPGPRCNIVICTKWRPKNRT